METQYQRFGLSQLFREENQKGRWSVAAIQEWNPVCRFHCAGRAGCLTNWKQRRPAVLAESQQTRDSKLKSIFRCRCDSRETSSMAVSENRGKKRIDRKQNHEFSRFDLPLHKDDVWFPSKLRQRRPSGPAPPTQSLWLRLNHFYESDLPDAARNGFLEVIWQHFSSSCNCPIS